MKVSEKPLFIRFIFYVLEEELFSSMAIMLLLILVLIYFNFITGCEDLLHVCCIIVVSVHAQLLSAL